MERISPHPPGHAEVPPLPPAHHQTRSTGGAPNAGFAPTSSLPEVEITSAIKVNDATPYDHQSPAAGLDPTPAFSPLESRPTQRHNRVEIDQDQPIGHLTSTLLLAKSLVGDNLGRAAMIGVAAATIIALATVGVKSWIGADSPTDAVVAGLLATSTTPHQPTTETAAPTSGSTTQVSPDMDEELPAFITEQDTGTARLLSAPGSAPPEAEPSTLVEPAVEPESEWVDAGHGIRMPDVMLRLRFCESTNNYRAAHTVSSARGAYQFLSGSWEYYGHAARYGVVTADLATPAQQDEAALLTWRKDGLRPWAASRDCWANPNIDPSYRTATPPGSAAPTSTTTPESTTTTAPTTTAPTTTAAPTTKAPTTAAPTTAAPTTAQATTTTAEPTTTTAETTTSTTTAATTEATGDPNSSSTGTESTGA